MKKQFLLFFILSIIFVSMSFYSCTTAYIPNELNAPAFHEKNEFKGSLTYGSSGTNLSAGYSLPGNIAITGNISYLNKKGSNPEFQRVWGFAAGYFNKLQKGKSPYYEVFAGFITGETRSSYESTDWTNQSLYENAKYYKIFIQPDISFDFGFIDLIFAMRMQYMKFTDYNREDITNPELPKAYALEPAATLRMGSEYIQFRMQIGTSLLMQRTGTEFNYKKNFAHFGLGFGF
jgi:hypothetical protein